MNVENTKKKIFNFKLIVNNVKIILTFYIKCIIYIDFSQEELFYATKRFIVLRDLKITTSESDPFKPFEDNAIIVNYVPLISNKRTELRSMSEK